MELDIRFSVTYSPGLFRHALHDLAKGRLRTEPVVMGVMRAGKPQPPVDALADGERQASLPINFRI
ncbi:MAG: hypothetical protein AB7E60_06585 [Sphingobium sp.]